MRTCARSSQRIMRTILKSSRNAPRKALTHRKSKNKIKMEKEKGKGKKAKLTRMRKTIKWEIAKTTSLPTSLA